MQSLVRVAAGIISLASALVWVPLCLLFGGKLLEQFQTGGSGLIHILGILLPLVLTLVSAAMSVLFALGAVSIRLGSPRPKLWAWCIISGLITCSVTWWSVLRKAGAVPLQ
jgi:hypothetical protein